MDKSSVLKILEEHVKQLPKEKIASLIERPKSLSMGDFAFPCFLLTDPSHYDEMWEDVEKDFFTQKNPAEIATHLSDEINAKSIAPFKKIEAKGPFLNFFIDKEELAKNIIGISQNFGEQKLHKSKVMTEFCHVNTHKAIHIGHIRNIALGESISRILASVGYDVKRANYGGDVGMHVSKALWGLQNLDKLGLTKPKDNLGKWLGEVYVKSTALAKENEAVNNEVIELNQKFFAGDKDLIKLWKESRQWSFDYFDESLYPDFGVKFDRLYWESECEKEGVKIALDLLEKGIAKKSQGAIVMDLKKFGLDIFLILKSDGTPLYATKELYLAKLQEKEVHPDKILHIVDVGQSLYFKQFFKTLEIVGDKTANKQEHLAYELVNFEGGGRMKSREGAIFFDEVRQLIFESAKEKIVERNKTLSNEELDRRATITMRAALKYGMLSQTPGRVISFSPEKSTEFEGNTGPYLLYSYARASSIFRKGNKPHDHKKVAIPELTNHEIGLISKISLFPEIVERAADSLNPSLIANYAFELAQLFNEFYHATPVLKSKEELFRLHLVDSFRITLKNALNLLGIETLEEM